MSRVSSIGSGGVVGYRKQGEQQEQQQDADPQHDQQQDRQKPITGPAPDRMEKKRSATAAKSAVAASAIPTGEADASPEAQRAGLRARLDELESTFRFMGKGHPQYESFHAQIEQLKAMLAALGG